LLHSFVTIVTLCPPLTNAPPSNRVTVSIPPTLGANRSLTSRIFNSQNRQANLLEIEIEKSLLVFGKEITNWVNAIVYPLRICEIVPFSARFLGTIKTMRPRFNVSTFLTF